MTVKSLKYPYPLLIHLGEHDRDNPSCEEGALKPLAVKTPDYRFGIWTAGGQPGLLWLPPNDAVYYFAYPVKLAEYLECQRKVAR